MVIHNHRGIFTIDKTVVIIEENGDDLKIARNTTDILSKHLTNARPRGVLDVIGITDATIIRALPTSLLRIA